jgi:plastocyanin
MKYLHGRPRVFVVVLVALSIATLSFGLSVRGASAQDTAVAIVDFAFQPASLTVTAGSTVTWTNSGAVPHTVTSDSGAFDSGVLQPGASFSHTFDTAGTFSYLCTIHPNMTGAITVTEAAAAAAPAPAATTPAAPAPAAAPQVARVPSTGVGVATNASGTIALLVALAALSLGLATRLARRS